MTTIRDSLTRKNEQSPQMDYLWRVELPSLDAISGDMLASGLGLGNSFSGGFSFRSALAFANQLGDLSNNLLPQDMNDINHRVYSFGAPFKSFDTKKITKGPSFTYAASQRDIGAISMTVDEMEDGKTLDYFNRWMGLIEPNDWYHNAPAVYKRDIRYVKLSTTKLDLHYSIYRGYFPTEISPTETSYDGNSVLQYSVTLTGDSVDHVVIPEAQLVSMITAEEEAILRQQFGGGGFRFGSIDTARAARVLDNVLDVFRR